MAGTGVYRVPVPVQVPVHYPSRQTTSTRTYPSIRLVSQTRQSDSSNIYSSVRLVNQTRQIDSSDRLVRQTRQTVLYVWSLVLYVWSGTGHVRLVRYWSVMSGTGKSCPGSVSHVRDQSCAVWPVICGMASHVRYGQSGTVRYRQVPSSRA